MMPAPLVAVLTHTAQLLPGSTITGTLYHFTMIDSLAIHGGHEDTNMDTFWALRAKALGHNHWHSH